jgi:hypothetical protein
MGLWVARRLLWMTGGVIFLALLPPSFPNAAAHALSLALIAAELVLLVGPASWRPLPTTSSSAL